MEIDNLSSVEPIMYFSTERFLSLFLYVAKVGTWDYKFKSEAKGCFLKWDKNLGWEHVLDWDGVCKPGWFQFWAYFSCQCIFFLIYAEE